MTHIDGLGHAQMVDVSEKQATTREAHAAGRVILGPTAYSMLLDNSIPKGDVLAVARIAGIMAAKKVDSLIPLCHSLPLEGVKVEFTNVDRDFAVEIKASARLTGKTGVEMEALTAVSVAALTIYDMCKAVEKGIVIEKIHLLRKSGGKSGLWDLETASKQE